MLTSNITLLAFVITTFVIVKWIFGRVHRLGKPYKTQQLTLGVVTALLMGLVSHRLGCSPPLSSLIGLLLFTQYVSSVFRLSLHHNAELVVLPGLFEPGHVQIHLAKPEQKFTKAAYRELPVILEKLGQQGVETVTLSSPLFGKNDGELRERKTFNRIVGEYDPDPDWNKVSWYHVPLSTLTILFAKYIKRADTLKNAQINNWYQVTLTLNPTPQLSPIR
ncbi:hypothetical protein [Vibrio sp. WXL103]|uniref:hypothetical protein n=1 Tax=unclassified Vibrio TaxID=2614977 RepID=UPI003EC8CDBB